MFNIKLYYCLKVKEKNPYRIQMFCDITVT